MFGGTGTDGWNIDLDGGRAERAGQTYPSLTSEMVLAWTGTATISFSMRPHGPRGRIKCPVQMRTKRGIWGRVLLVSPSIRVKLHSLTQVFPTLVRSNHCPSLRLRFL